MNVYPVTRLRPRHRPAPFALLRQRIPTTGYRPLFSRPAWCRLPTITVVAAGLFVALVVLSSWIGHPAILAGLMTLLVFGVCLAAFVVEEPNLKDR